VKFFLSLIAVSNLFYCTTDVTGAGGSSETLNAKVTISDTALSVTIEEKTVESLKLHLFSLDYKPYETTGIHDSCEITHSNYLQWKSPHQGSFNALITTGNVDLSCFSQNINIGGGIDTVLHLSLKPSLKISGKIVTSRGKPLQESYLVSIYGSPFYTLTDNNNNFSFDKIPGGQFTFSVHPSGRRLFMRTSDFFLITDSLRENSRLQLSLP
jgi:hypothetical protein